MVELIGLHCFDEADVVNVFRKMRQSVRNPRAAIATLAERILGAKHFGCPLDEGESFSLQKFAGALLAIQLLEIRFEIEQLQLAGGTNHVQEDHSLCRGRQRGFKCVERVVGSMVGEVG